MKKWKIFLSAFILAAAAAGGTVYYFLNVKEYKTADKKVEEIVEAEYQIKLPEPGPAPSTASAGTAEQGADQAEGNGQAAPANGGQRTAKAAELKDHSTAGKPTKPTAAHIIAKYQPAFQELQSQADSKLNTLLSYAFSEYQAKQANGEDISYFYFYNKYNSAAKKLEASTDASFNYIYNALVKELKNYGYSGNEAKPIKEQYVSTKKQTRAALMDQAMAALK